MSQEQTSTDAQPTTGVAEPVSNTIQDTADNQPAKVYTQAELDAVAAEVRRKAEAKYTKKFEGIDVEKYQTFLAKKKSKKFHKPRRSQSLKNC